MILLNVWHAWEYHTECISEEATEVMQDTNGRWFPFSVTMGTIFILEKQKLPDHLATLPSIDSPTPLGTILRELEDAGEAGATNKYSGERYFLVGIINKKHQN